MHYRRANALMLLIAANPRTPHKVLSQLAKEEDPQLLEHIAENENTHARTLLFLATHPLNSVRIALTQNMNLPSNIVWKLRKDEDPDVRYSLACNPQISLDALIALREDDNPYVSARARQTIERICEEQALDEVEQTSTLVDINRRMWRTQNAEEAV